MANRLKSNPIVIDATDSAVPGPLHIQAIAWMSTQVSGMDIAADDDLTLKSRDATGAIVLEKRAETADDPLMISFSGGWNVPDGLYVEDLDGGQLYIWV